MARNGIALAIVYTLSRKHVLITELIVHLLVLVLGGKQGELGFDPFDMMGQAWLFIQGAMKRRVSISLTATIDHHVKQRRP